MDESNTQLYEKFSRLQWLLHKQYHRTQAEGGPMADPSRGQGRILAMLKLQDGIATKDLAYLLGIRVSSLNELLAKMERGGYIRREPSETDRRVILVWLTEKGKNEPQEGINPGDVFECFTEEEKETLSGYIDRLIAALSAEIGEEPDENERQRQMHGARPRRDEEMFGRLGFGAQGRNPMEGHGAFPDRPDRPNRPDRPDTPGMPPMAQPWHPHGKEEK